MTKHREGSRPWLLSKLAMGESKLFEVPEGQSTSELMGNIGLDARRADTNIKQVQILGVIPGNPRVIQIIQVTRVEAEVPDPFKRRYRHGKTL